jgi:hypothetical protein
VFDDGVRTLRPAHDVRLQATVVALVDLDSPAAPEAKNLLRPQGAHAMAQVGRVPRSGQKRSPSAFPVSAKIVPAVTETSWPHPLSLRLLERSGYRYWIGLRR